MKISGKELEKLNKEGLITFEQVEQITNYYQTNNDNNKLWKILFIIAALHIALGIILIIGVTWSAIPNFIKIAVDFIIFLVLVYADYYFIINNKKNLSEVFLVISFFMVAGTIGIISQVYNLDGGWLSFARFWMLLTIPFIFLSKTFLINIFWLLLLCNSFPESFYTYMHDIYSFFVDKLLPFQTIPFQSRYNVSIFLILQYCVLVFLHSIATNLYIKFNRKIIIIKAFSILTKLTAYYTVLSLVFQRNIIDITFIFCLSAYSLYKAFQNKKEKSFINYAILTEIYIIYLFLTAYYMF